MNGVSLIGVDCAVDPVNTGLCRAIYRNGSVHVVEALDGAGCEPARKVAGWIRPGPSLVGMDSPLGWPAPLGDSLQGHRAGDELLPSAHTLFRRRTDDFTAMTIGKRPMDVGADRIARTARAALGLLATLRGLTGQPCPLGWTPGECGDECRVLETYPAAWLTVNGQPNRGYKKPEQRGVREAILHGLQPRIVLECGPDPFLDNADVLDALLCILVCLDYLEGRVVSPPSEERELAAREGWIWFPSRAADQTGSLPAITSR